MSPERHRLSLWRGEAFCWHARLAALFQSGFIPCKVPHMTMQTMDALLLTGAGFTKNFGGLLGSEIWHRVFNRPEIQAAPRIREVLLRTFNFEDAYAQIVDDPSSTDEEKKIFTDALREAYEDMDALVRAWIMPGVGPKSAHPNGIGNFLNLFLGRGGKRGMIFTLNQDLFLERMFGHKAAGPVSYPVDLRQNQGVSIRNERILLPNREAVDNFVTNDLKADTNSPLYVKLHGSYGWYAHDGSDRMIIGRNKKTQIDQEPLLKAYYGIFEEAIAQGDKRLLVCGYGFGDEHINETLFVGAKKHGLKLYILGPSTPEKIASMMRSKNLWSYVHGVFPYSFEQMCPGNGSRAPMIEEIGKVLL